MKQRDYTVVLIAPNWLGDAVMCLPLLGYLHAVRGLKTIVVAPPSIARAFFGLDEVGELIVLGRSGRTRGLGARAKAIRTLNADGGMVLPPSFSAALTLFLGRVPQRFGFAGDGRSFLLQGALPSAGLREEHLSDNYMRLGKAMVARLGLDGALRGACPRVKVFEGEREALRRILRSHGVPSGDYAVVTPGATYGPTKHWPSQKYRALVDRLRADIPIVLAGTGAERAVCASLAHGLSGVYPLAGDTSLGEFFALVEKSRVVVANDSGASHVAASIGVPVVTIFGSTSPRWTRPLGSGVRVVSEPVHCSPCFRRECPTELECYEGIAPDRVFAEATAAIREQGAARVGLA
jgi:heptosyltransferase-2